MLRTLSGMLVLLILCGAVVSMPARANAQGVTTATIAGVVKDASGAVLPGVTITAVHLPSDTTYTAITQGDGRFNIPGMRIGGPYTVSAVLQGFQTAEQREVMLSLGVTQDLTFTLGPAQVSESLVVTAESSPIFSSARTGAATAITRELATLPTCPGRINDLTRLTPQYGAVGSFAGQDNRMNNITVDGSYFNNSFGLGGQPGDRTNVAPISLEAIEQIQVSVAPYDVRQGNFVGAGVNTVTRSGANRFSGSFYYRTRNESYVGTEASGQSSTPFGDRHRRVGRRADHPNRLFFFETSSQSDKRPLTTFVSARRRAASRQHDASRPTSQTSAPCWIEVQLSDGPFDGISETRPASHFSSGRLQHQLEQQGQLPYSQLPRAPTCLSSSSSLGFGRQTFSTNFLNFQGSDYSILENIKSGIGEWNSVIGSSMSNNLIIGYTKQDESRGQLGDLFPFVDILQGGNAYTSIGSEPFTPANLLLYNTFQAQDSFTKYRGNQAFTFGGAVEKPGQPVLSGHQSAYVYNSLDDFYTDLNGYLANPNRTTSPVVLNKFQVRYSNVPGSTSPPFQPLDVWYISGYAQDEWRPKSNLTVTAGVRMDVANFGDTGYDNPLVDSFAFRDQGGNPVHYNTGALPKASPLWSPRVGFNWDVNSDQATQIRGGTGVFTGKPAYVWISNQIGNSGMLTGFIQATNTTAFPFNPNPDAYKLAATGQPPASADVAVTDNNFKFPQTWRTNIAIDRKIPWGMIATGEYIYNHDVNGMNYINANLPAAQSAFTGVDARPNWTNGRLNASVVENIVLAGRRPFVVARGRPTAREGVRLQGRLQLQQVAQHGRSGLNRGRFVDGQPDRQRPEQPGAGALGLLGRPAILRRADLHAQLLQVRRDDDWRVLRHVARLPRHRVQHELHLLG